MIYWCVLSHVEYLAMRRLACGRQASFLWLQQYSIETPAELDPGPAS